ncbi:hypothetical protein BDZ91DRAFT_714793 [Kalaharituber pfeilii]|nr:hypothetical protein BDZ91DRAFT_714793 [Kalaharituber pfeilii]
MASQDPSQSSETPIPPNRPRGRPRTATPSSRSSASTEALRTRLNEQEKLHLARLCIQNQAEHQPGQKGKFWEKIKILLKDEIGKELRDPQATMKNMLLQFEIEEEKEAKESGTVQNLKQALRAWKEHIQDLEKRADDLKKSQSQLDQEAKESTIHQDNLLRVLSQKREVIDLDMDTNSESDDKKVKKEVQSTYKRRRINVKAEASNKALAKSMDSAGEKLAKAIESLGKEMSREVLPEREEQLKGLEQQLKTQAEEIKKQAEETTEIKNMLKELLSRFPI